MTTRRNILKSLVILPLANAALISNPLKSFASNPAPYRDFFKELGVRTFINAAGTYTGMTGSLMNDEVLNAYLYASKEYVNLDELQDKVGERIASLLHCEAATVTSGAASALTLATAGILTGMDDIKATQLPLLEGTGMKSEVIIQKAHEIVYVHAIKNCGVKLVYVETREELESAINEKTALMFFLNANNLEGKIQVEEYLQIAKKHNIPTLIDCAADVPPVENFWKFTKMGYDVACFSGGKAIRGPQSAGLLLGKKGFIAAARLNAPPRGNTIGRGMKVNKEEILAMMVALENFLEKDLEKEWALWEKQIALINETIRSIKGITTLVVVPPIANHVPTLNVSWNINSINISGDKLKEILRNGHPSIEVAGGGANSISITTWMFNPGEERIVATRVREALLKASV